jgi:hypothetical protein
VTSAVTFTIGAAQATLLGSTNYWYFDTVTTGAVALKVVISANTSAVLYNVSYTLYNY